MRRTERKSSTKPTATKTSVSYPFPLGILAVNLAGTLALGLAAIVLGHWLGTML